MRLLPVLLCVAACKGGEPLSEADLAALERSRTEVGEEWTGTMLYNHPDNPFLQEIPDDYEVHENSVEMIDLIKSQTGANFTNTSLSTGSFSIPVFVADDQTAVRDIEFYLYGNPPQTTHMTDVPFLVGSQPATGSDSHYTIIQEDSRCVYEFWLFDYDRAGGGNAHTVDGVGIYTDGRSSVAAGWSALQGIIWPRELRDYHIPHALSFAVPVTNLNGHVSPATKNDGALSDNEFAIPEGTLIRIRPDFDLDSISGLRPIDRAVYEAIQTYGMYCGDTNGAGLSIRAVSPESVHPEAFPEEFDTDNPNGVFFLENFPFDALEVVSSGPMLTTPDVRDYVDHGCAEWR
jgi:hypothetical protein